VVEKKIWLGGVKKSARKNTAKFIIPPNKTQKHRKMLLKIKIILQKLYFYKKSYTFAAVFNFLTKSFIFIYETI
jgi:hypothetical protein